MKFVRFFWGDINLFGGKYYNQIKDRSKENLEQTVFVWGEENYKIIKQFGYNCELISKYPYDLDISDNHTFFSHKNLNHKLKGLKIAAELYEKIVFLDWDCIKIKEVDNNFYELLNRGSDLQVPLYVYPSRALSLMIENSNNEMLSFFIKLKKFIEKNSYKLEDNFIIPNTGFIFCKNVEIANKLYQISLDNNYECVPDEFSVFFYYIKNSIEDYIKHNEPIVMGKKEHGYDWWNDEEEKFFSFKKTHREKDIYFIHN